MKNIHRIEFYTGSKEELLPDFENDFPYIASRAELDKYIGRYVPWQAAVVNVVSSIRRKIGAGYIETVVGSGYRFVV